MGAEEIAYEQLLLGIQGYVDRSLENHNGDVTVVGIIKGTTDNGYKVSINNVEYDDVPTIGGECNYNETVYVLAPQGNYNNMVILKGGSGQDSGSVISGVSSVNGKTGDVILNNTDVGALSNSYKNKIDLWDLLVNNDGSVSLIYNGV